MRAWRETPQPVHGRGAQGVGSCMGSRQKDAERCQMLPQPPRRSATSGGMQIAPEGRNRGLIQHAGGGRGAGAEHVLGGVWGRALGEMSFGSEKGT